MALAYFPLVPSAWDSLSIRFHTIAQSEIKKKEKKTSRPQRNWKYHLGGAKCCQGQRQKNKAGKTPSIEQSM